MTLEVTHRLESPPSRVLEVVQVLLLVGPHQLLNLAEVPNLESFAVLGLHREQLLSHGPESLLGERLHGQFLGHLLELIHVFRICHQRVPGGYQPVIHETAVVNGEHVVRSPQSHHSRVFADNPHRSETDTNTALTVEAVREQDVGLEIVSQDVHRFGAHGDVTCGSVLLKRPRCLELGSSHDHGIQEVKSLPILQNLVIFAYDTQRGLGIHPRSAVHLRNAVESRRPTLLLRGEVQRPLLDLEIQPGNLQSRLHGVDVLQVDAHGGQPALSPVNLGTLENPLDFLGVIVGVETIDVEGIGLGGHVGVQIGVHVHILLIDVGVQGDDVAGVDIGVHF